MATYTSSAKKKTSVLEKMNNTVGDVRGSKTRSKNVATKRVKTAAQNEGSKEFDWKWGMLENMSSSRSKKRSSMLEAHSVVGANYTQVGSSKKKKPIDFYEAHDSRCSSSIATHTAK